MIYYKNNTTLIWAHIGKYNIFFVNLMSHHPGYQNKFFLIVHKETDVIIIVSLPLYYVKKFLNMGVYVCKIWNFDMNYKILFYLCLV